MYCLHARTFFMPNNYYFGPTDSAHWSDGKPIALQIFMHKKKNTMLRAMTNVFWCRFFVAKLIFPYSRGSEGCPARNSKTSPPPPPRPPPTAVLRACNANQYCETFAHFAAKRTNSALHRRQPFYLGTTCELNVQKGKEYNCVIWLEQKKKYGKRDENSKNQTLFFSKHLTWSTRGKSYLLLGLAWLNTANIAFTRPEESVTIVWDWSL